MAASVVRRPSRATFAAPQPASRPSRVETATSTSQVLASAQVLATDGWFKFNVTEDSITVTKAATGLQAAGKATVNPNGGILSSSTTGVTYSSSHLGIGGSGQPATRIQLFATSSSSPSSRSATLVSSTFWLEMPPSGAASTVTVSLRPLPLANFDNTFV